ncbi:MAG: penicillin-binding transpeptidase domain-containing protein, partial [Rhodothermales bacterium]
ARNMFPDQIGREITLTRKLKEAITALKIEWAFDKDEILEAYLNTVPFYFGAYGIEMAARTYFDKSASDLTLLESATLVGMLKGTYYYNPVRNPERALSRRNVALLQMVKRGFLDDVEYERMKDGPIRLNFERQPEPGSLASHFTEHVRMWLIDWADRNDYNIYRDSLVIHTTLDMGLQNLAQRAVQRQGDALQAVADVEWGRPTARLLARDAGAYFRFRNPSRAFDYLWETRPQLISSFIRSTYEYRSGIDAGIDEEVMLDSLMSDPAFVDSIKTARTRLQVGFTAIDPETGHVKAWVGSRDFKKDQYDHVARARRQPGSTFKPFVYARALQEGYTPNDKLIDREVEIPLEGGYVWRPTNSGETVSGREYTLTDGLVYSKNTITAQLVDDIGAGDVARLARRMGVNRSQLRPVPSLALGTSEVSLLEMASAYATFASLGIYREPIVVTRIEDRRGRVLAEFEGRERKALSEKTSRAVIDMMRGVVDRGTGNRIRSTFGIRKDVAGKTGTTQNSADGWFILMHPNLVAGSWIGFNDPRVTFRTD